MSLNRIRRIVIGIGAAAMLAAVPIAVFAQGAPPSPPTTYWGSANGATEGQPVIAFVGSGSAAQYCGSDVVQDDEDAGIVYAISVDQDASVSGCGANGRLVRLYFAATDVAPAAFATQSLAWQPAGLEQEDVTLGSPLSNKIIAPGIRANP